MEEGKIEESRKNRYKLREPKQEREGRKREREKVRNKRAMEERGMSMGG